MAEKNTSIRIVKKVKGGHGGHHGGAWKVAYADFVTALMAFFIVMWIIGQSASVQSAVSGYFKDPVAFMEAVKAGNAPFNVGDPTKDGGKNKVTEADLQKAEREKLKTAKDMLEKMVLATPEFKDLKSHIDIKLVDEGLRIDLVEDKESLFFDAGSASVKSSTRSLLAKMANELGGLPNSVVLEGHTDSRPLNRGSFTNWELSADRANSARRVMEGSGLHQKQVAQVRGYAATQPRDPEHPEAASNRRVSIIVMMTGAMQRQKIGDGPIADSLKIAP